jgi:DNA-binding IclR family transcriptional regulator
MKQYPSGEVPVNSVATSFRIIELLYEDEPLTPSEVAEKLDIAVSTAHRHLMTLNQFGYISKEGMTYKLGLRFLEIGEQSRHQLKIYRVAKAKIDQLAEKTGEAAQLMAEEKGIGIRLYLKGGEQSVTTNTMAGQHVCLHTNATGKAILANLPETRREEIINQMQLPKQTENTVTDPDRLKELLGEVRERGFAFNDEERIRGLRGVATPIKGKDDEVVAAISISGPLKRFKGDWFQEELPSILSGAANEIELKLKYSYPE